MVAVILAALGVGGATVLGALGGFLFQKTIYKHRDTVNAFSAGLMTVAAVCGLILPSRAYGGVTVAVFGILLGALCLILCDRFAPESQTSDQSKQAVYLLFIAIAIHNLPEGMAAGVSFGTDDLHAAFTVAGEIAVQNIPEGMVIIGPMLASGMSPRKTVLLALSTGGIEIIGTFIGYYAVGLTQTILPLVLSIAGGMMLYVIILEMIPLSCTDKKRTVSCILGFIGMLLFDSLI